SHRVRSTTLGRRLQLGPVPGRFHVLRARGRARCGCGCAMKASGRPGGQELDQANVETVGRDRAHAYVVGACVEMLVDATPKRRLIAPGDQRIDQPVRAAAGEVAVVEPHFLPRAAIVREAEVAGYGIAPDATRACRVAFEYHLLLDAQQLVASKD